MPREGEKRFDLCVVGCGTGGFAAAMRALDLGKHVCIIEGGEIGGAGVKWGALASKTMWELAKDYSVASKVDRGYRATGLSVNYDAMRTTVLQAVKEKQYQMLSQMESYSPRRWGGPGSVTLKRGWGRFTVAHSMRVSYGEGADETVEADHFLISTGSKPRPFPGIAVDGERILDSDSILGLGRFPARLMIIGAGIIGCEYATIFANFGQTEVFLIDHKETVIPYEDRDISDFVSHSLARIGVKIIHSAQLQDIRKRTDHLEVVLDFSDGHSEVVEVDTVLISIGRVARLDGLGLEAVRIVPHERGHLETDANCRVRERVYAVGDVTNHPALVNIAEKEARHAVKHMFGHGDFPLNYNNLSTIMFFHPAVAAVGLSEKACRGKNIPFKMAYYANDLVTRAIAMRSMDGFVKILVSDDKEQKILGMRGAGPQISSTVVSIAHFMDQGNGAGDVLKLLYPHPTVSESIQECLRLLLGKSLYKPRAFPGRIQLRRWRPDGGYTDL